jgi:predicted secreted protein
MLKLICSVLLIAFVTTAPAPGAIAAEAAALKVYGFSPDGRYFAFAQHGGQGDGGHASAEITVIDAEQDRFAPGFPVRVEPTDFEDKPGAPEEGEQAVAIAEKRAGARLKFLAVTRPGQVLARDPAVVAADTASYSAGNDLGPKPGGRTMSFNHPRLGRMELALTPKAFDWPATSRHGRHKEAASCKQEVDWQKGAGFRLTLARAGTSLVLADDKTIPASRHCVLSYGLAEVHAFDRPDGAVTLAVVLDMYVRGFEGEDRRFLVVTRVLKP